MRTLMYKTPEDLQEAVDGYFAQQVADEKPFTMAGLAYHLGLSRQGLCDYSHRDDYGAVVVKARQRVEIFLEERLLLANATGPIFNLKNNFGWKDKTEREHSGALRVEAIERTIVDPEDTDS